MKCAVASLVLAACAGTGCVSLPSWWDKPKPPTVAANPAPLRRPVSADQITESNAREMAGALVDELDRDN